MKYEDVWTKNAVQYLTALILFIFSCFT